jgi:hypothetical protein
MLVLIRGVPLIQNDGETFDRAYARLMGVIMVACWVTVAISFMPPKAVRRVGTLVLGLFWCTHIH